LENYLKLRTRSPFTYSYLFLDCEEYLADQLFIKYRVPVKFGEEFCRKDSKYRVIRCKIRKRYEESFQKAMADMEDKMILRGYPGYAEFCENFFDQINKARCELPVAGQRAVSGV
jgi:hypothetical protein